jgi:hypothetical protein
VAWPTDGGNLYVGLAREPGMRYRVQAKDAIASAPAFLPPNKVFAASLDGYLYCVSENRGNVLWRFTTGEPISHSPVALGSTVYVITDRGSMFAINADDGKERWIQGGVRSYVAGNAQRLYCLDRGGNLIILETGTGSRLGSIPVGQLDMPFINVETDRIILASSTGLVQCFREANLPWPVAHLRNEAPQSSLPAVKTVTTPQPAGAAPPAAAGGDPFGAGADPFAPKPAGAAPPATPPAGGEPDPFATPKTP